MPKAQPLARWLISRATAGRGKDWWHPADDNMGGGAAQELEARGENGCLASARFDCVAHETNSGRNATEKSAPQSRRIAVPDMAGGDPFSGARRGRGGGDGAVRHAEQGVTVAFVDTPHGGTLVELLAPLSDDSPSRLPAKNPQGGQHHRCFELPEIKRRRAESRLRASESLARPASAHTGRDLFVHPDMAAC